MKVCGYDFRNALTRLNNRRSLLQSQWNDSLYAFEDEDHDPVALAEKLLELENRIVRVQLAQDEYNAKVVAFIESASGSEEMPLAVAIKRVGPIRRVSALWRKYAAESGSNDYPYGRLGRTRARVRTAETEEARRVVSAEDCMKRHEQYQDLELALGNAIAKANALVVEVASLSASDLEVEV